MASSLKSAASLGSLSSSSRYQHHLHLLRDALAAACIDNLDLLNDSNAIIQDIDQDVYLTHRFVSETYAEKFPELEGLIPNRMDYIRTVQRIGNEMDLSLVDLRDILNNKLVMLVSVSSSTTSGQPLSAEKLSYVLRGCEEILKLEEDKKLVLSYLEACMNKIAPNLCALVGSHVTAQLFGVAGGLEALCKIPACNLQVLGQERRSLLGMSGHSSLAHAGILAHCDIVQAAPPDLKKKAVKTLAAKVALAARIDLSRSHTLHAQQALASSSGGDGSMENVDDAEGSRLREQVASKLEKLQEPPKARTKKALPVPEDKKKPRRGDE
jgi:U4/U6 small nuclear ribonucleoprotein PRP31